MSFTEINKLDNLLPFDGTVYYYGCVFSEKDSNVFFEALMNGIAWKNDQSIMFGKRIVTKRKVAWYADEPLAYTYSKITRQAIPWTCTLLELKSQVENICGETFNSCLLNLYHNGDEGMGWHSDDEPDLLENGAIASVSLGAERRFVLKHKKFGQKIESILEHGSLLIMKGETQKYWLHKIPPAKSIHTPRINLTFRTITKTRKM